jgi:hypothetical protein
MSLEAQPGLGRFSREATLPQPGLALPTFVHCGYGISDHAGYRSRVKPVARVRLPPLAQHLGMSPEDGPSLRTV